MATKKRAAKKTRKAKAGTPKKRARSRKGPFGAKAEFIRSFPPDKPAKQIVEEGTAKGLRFSVAYVYGLRARANKKAGVAPSRARSARGPASQQTGLAGKLRAVIAEVGLTRTREVLSEVEAAFGGK